MRQPTRSGVRPVRRFGEPPVAGRRYVERPGAYAVIRNRGKVLMVEWQGQLYLPGGGIDPGEGTLAALHRECLEETGWRIRVERRLGAFQRYLYAADLDVWLRKVCHVYLARPALRIGGPTQPGHCAVWMPVGDAATRLSGAGERAFLSRLSAQPDRSVWPSL
jgi:8-oxo-dGTP diphosphatase